MSNPSTFKIPIRTTGGLDGAVEVSVGIIVFCMLSLLSVQIFFRYVLNNSIYWAEEIVRYMFTWMIFLGAAVNVRRKGHIVIEVLLERMPPKVQRPVELLVHVQVMIVLVVMTIKGAQFTYMTRDSQSMVTDIPLACLYAAVPVSFALMTRSYIRLIWERYFKKDQAQTPQETSEP